MDKCRLRTLHAPSSPGKTLPRLAQHWCKACSPSTTERESLKTADSSTAPRPFSRPRLRPLNSEQTTSSLRHPSSPRYSPSTLALNNHTKTIDVSLLQRLPLVPSYSRLFRLFALLERSRRGRMPILSATALICAKLLPQPTQRPASHTEHRESQQITDRLTGTATSSTASKYVKMTAQSLSIGKLTSPDSSPTPISKHVKLVEQ